VPALEVTSRRDGPLGVLTLVGEARLETSEAIRTKGAALLSTGATHLLVDVRSLAFVDSASLGALIELQSRISETGGRMILLGPTERVKRVIGVTGLSGHLRVAPDEATARAQFVR
jgi:anti-anti-sigma factor